MTVTLTLKGKEALFAKLIKLAPGVEKGMGDANLQSANEMADLARGYVPVKSGTLKASIRVEQGPRPGGYYVKAGGAPTTKSVRSGSGTGFDYATAVEFGTKPHINAGEFKGSQNPGAKKESFFWVSYRLMKRRLKSRNSRALNKIVKAIMSSQ